MTAMVIVMSFNFNFVARNRQVALRIMGELKELPEVPEEVAVFIEKSIYGMDLPQEDTMIEVKAEGHMPQVTGNSSQLGNCIISVKAISVRD